MRNINSELPVDLPINEPIEFSEIIESDETAYEIAAEINDSEAEKKSEPIIIPEKTRAAKRKAMNIIQPKFFSENSSQQKPQAKSTKVRFS